MSHRFFVVALSASILLAACGQSKTETAPESSEPILKVERTSVDDAEPDLEQPLDLQIEIPPASAGKSDPILEPTGEPENENDVRAQAGQLTAGEWRDTEHWAHWEELLLETGEEDGPDYQQYEDVWGFYTTRARFPVEVVDEEGRPVIDAEVELHASERTVWTARTDAHGRAELFDGLYGASSDGPYELAVRHGGAQWKRADVAPGERIRVALDNEFVAPLRVDLMFVVDATGSMKDELRYLTTELQDVIQRVEKASPDLDLRVSVNFYRDEDDAYVVRSFPFVDDVDEVVATLGRQKANGGGDFPEAVHAALKDAVEGHRWSADARARLLFLVCDAPPHDDDQVKQQIRETTREAALRGIRMVPVAGSGIDKSTEFFLRFTSIATNGSYVFLTDDSGIGGGHIKPTIGNFDVELLNDLLVRLILEET